MKKIPLFLFSFFLFACNNEDGSSAKDASGSVSSSSENVASLSGKWEGSFSNGLTGATISFIIPDGGKELKELTFQGYWRCDGKLDLTTIGPEKSFVIENNSVSGIIVEPEDGGATAMRYELHARFNGDSAQGTFRMNINALGCDTYQLNWSAKKK